MATKIVGIRLAPDLVAIADQRASEAGVTVSAYCYSIIAAALRGKRPVKVIERLPGLGSASEETRREVASQGGKAKSKGAKHRPLPHVPNSLPMRQANSDHV